MVNKYRTACTTIVRSEAPIRTLPSNLVANAIASALVTSLALAAGCQPPPDNKFYVSETGGSLSGLYDCHCTHTVSALNSQDVFFQVHCMLNGFPGLGGPFITFTPDDPKVVDVPTVVSSISLQDNPGGTALVEAGPPMKDPDKSKTGMFFPLFVHRLEISPQYLCSDLTNCQNNPSQQDGHIDAGWFAGSGWCSQ